MRRNNVWQSVILLIVAGCADAPTDTSAKESRPPLQYNLSSGLLFADDFESTPIGTLSSDYTPVIGTMEVVSGTQRDGTQGQLLGGGDCSQQCAVLLNSINAISDVRIQFDHSSHGQSGGRLLLRATDPQNGYVVEFTSGLGAVAFLAKLVGGVRTELAAGSLGVPRDGWRRFTIEAEGQEIRVTDGEGLVMRATDPTFSTGQIFLGGWGPLYDNLTIDTDLTPRVAAAPISLPFATNFEDLELRSGALQHPNMDLIGTTGAITYRRDLQRDGSIGRMLWVGTGPAETVLGGVQPLNSSLVSIVSAPLANIRIQFDHFSHGQSGGRLWLRATDHENGYVVEFTSGSGAVAFLAKLVGGVRTELAAGSLGITGDPWRRFTIEADGQEIRVTDGAGLVMRATDATFSTGQIFLGGWSPLYDNLTIQQLDDLEPVVSDVLANPNPVSINSDITLTAVVDDQLTGGSIIASAEYSIDGSSFTPMLPADGSYDEVSELVTIELGPFAAAGVHDVCVRGSDAAGNVSALECIFLAVYDPEGSFVTGGGWITSPPGAYTPNPALLGKAHFGFVSKYKKGATVPTGVTEFQFQAGNLNFRSSTYEWLVVAGARAQYKGAGTINGAGGYGFMLTATDGAVAGGGGVDRFRIKIWNEATGTVVYDNEMGAGDTDDPSTAIGGGAIVIHR